MFAFGAEQRLVPPNSNPVIGVKKPTKETTRDRVLTDDEIRRLWSACATQNSYVSAWFRLRLVTAQRGGELQMRWKDTDPKSHFWTIPAEPQGLGQRAADGMETLGVPVARNSDGSSITGPVLARFSDMPANTTTLPILRGGVAGTADPFSLDTSLEERYGTHEQYVAKVRAAAERLVRGRYLLEDDAARLVAQAEASKVLK
jgi:hypothetical protein